MAAARSLEGDSVFGCEAVRRDSKGRPAEMRIRGASETLLQRLGPRVYRDVRQFGLKNVATCFVVQRVLRVNSHVPWPVHWSSSVIHPDRIVRKHWRPYPGYMPGQYVQATNGIVIGTNVRMGPGVKIISANHDLRDYDRHDSAPPVVIGDDCWLGANSIILPGVELGSHVVVAAGAVVASSFPRDCLVGGVPARVLRQLEPYHGASSS